MIVDDDPNVRELVSVLLQNHGFETCEAIDGRDAMQKITNGLLIGIGAMVLYFITNLLVLYGSRIREYYADKGSVELGNQPNQLATALYKLVNASARSRDKKAQKQVEGAKAFFVTDPTRSMTELSELSQIDRDKDGVIDQYELLTLRQMNIKLSFWAKFTELFTTHPNMLKRIKQLASYSVAS